MVSSTLPSFLDLISDYILMPFARDFMLDVRCKKYYIKKSKILKHEYWLNISKVQKHKNRWSNNPFVAKTLDQEQECESTKPMENEHTNEILVEHGQRANHIDSDGRVHYLPIYHVPKVWELAIQGHNHSNCHSNC